MKELRRNGLLHGDVMTVSGKRLAENLAAVLMLDEISREDIVMSVARPIAPRHIGLLKGNLAPPRTW